MVCKQCGSENSAASEVCSNCQARLSSAEKVVSLDDLISGSRVATRHLVNPETIVAPKPAQHEAAEWEIQPFPISAPPPKPIPTALLLPEVVAPVGGFKKGFFNYRHPETGQMSIAKLATARQRIGAATFDTLLIFTLVALPGALLAGLLAAAPIRQALGWPVYTRLNDLATTFIRPVTVSFVTVFTAFSFVYSVGTTMLGGQSWGKKRQKIRITLASGVAPRLRTALIRSAFGLLINLLLCLAVFLESPLLIFLTIPFLVGLALAFFNPARQGFHDKLAETYVVSSQEIVEGWHF